MRLRLVIEEKKRIENRIKEVIEKLKKKNREIFLFFFIIVYFNLMII